MLTEHETKSYLLGFYPGTRKLTPELITEMVQVLNNHSWESADLHAAVEAYRSRWFKSNNDRFKFVPELSMLLKLHKSEQQTADTEARQALHQDTQQPNDHTAVRWSDLPVNIHQAASRLCGQQDMVGLSKLFIEYFQNSGNIDRLEYWGGRFQHYTETAREVKQPTSGTIGAAVVSVVSDVVGPFKPKGPSK